MKKNDWFSKLFLGNHSFLQNLQSIKTNFPGKSSAALGRLQYTHLADATSDRRTNHYFQGGNSPVGGPLRSSQCPIQDFCLNGGSCQYFGAIGEQICQWVKIGKKNIGFIHQLFSCSRGYHGQRCELKYADTGSRGSAMSDRWEQIMTIFYSWW